MQLMKKMSLPSDARRYRVIMPEGSFCRWEEEGPLGNRTIARPGLKPGQDGVAHKETGHYFRPDRAQLSVLDEYDAFSFSGSRRLRWNCCIEYQKLKAHQAYPWRKDALQIASPFGDFPGKMQGLFPANAIPL